MSSETWKSDTNNPGRCRIDDRVTCTRRQFRAGVGQLYVGCSLLLAAFFSRDASRRARPIYLVDCGLTKRFLLESPYQERLTDLMRAMFSMTRTCLRNPLRMPQTRLLLPQRHAYSTAPSPPIGLDQGERNIYSKLASRFQPSQLQVQDISGACPPTCSFQIFYSYDFYGIK